MSHIMKLEFDLKMLGIIFIVYWIVTWTAFMSFGAFRINPCFAFIGIWSMQSTKHWYTTYKYSLVKQNLIGSYCSEFYHRIRDYINNHIKIQSGSRDPSVFIMCFNNITFQEWNKEICIMIIVIFNICIYCFPWKFYSSGVRDPFRILIGWK